ncbi:hypothetical protein [Methylobacterium phyllostachyos]|uniref:hypothetical protein n=1 Tax=Methylobacterium phyllostachyos TaxID=582672 RepID=UPI00115FE273|nr:hypothetical protein [Methylobacterium phyllostachyos]
MGRGIEPDASCCVPVERLKIGIDMTQYDIKVVDRHDQEPEERKPPVPRRRELDWERAMREAAEAELLIQCAD